SINGMMRLSGTWMWLFLYAIRPLSRGTGTPLYDSGINSSGESRTRIINDGAGRALDGKVQNTRFEEKHLPGRCSSQHVQGPSTAWIDSLANQSTPLRMTGLWWFLLACSRNHALVDASNLCESS